MTRRLFRCSLSDKVRRKSGVGGSSSVGFRTGNSGGAVFGGGGGSLSLGKAAAELHYFI